MCQQFFSAALAVLVGLSSVVASAATVHINRDDALHPTNPETEEATGTWVFTNTHPSDTAFPMPSISSTDLANGVLPVHISGLSVNNSFGTGLPKLTNGLAAVSADDPNNSFFLNNGTTATHIRISLSADAEITSINSYSWHRRGTGPAGTIGVGERNIQDYDVYGAASFVGDLNDLNNYVLIASVNTLLAAGNATTADANQTGVSIVPSSGDSLGIFRNFIFVIRPTVSASGSQGTFYSEIDIHGTFDIGNEIPEPGTFVLFGIGLVSLVGVACRRRIRKA